MRVTYHLHGFFSELAKVACHDSVHYLSTRRPCALSKEEYERRPGVTSLNVHGLSLRTLVLDILRMGKDHISTGSYSFKRLLCIL